MKKGFKQVLFEGDEYPKVNIVCDTIHEGLRAEFRDNHYRDKQNVKLIHCESISYIENNKDYREIYSPVVPYGVVIFMLFNKFDIDYSEFDEIVYLQPYPFTLEGVNSQIEEAEKIVKDLSGYDFKILFYRDINQHSGTGDLVSIDQALEEAPSKIRKRFEGLSIVNSLEFCVYRYPSDLLNIVRGGCGDLEVVIGLCSERFEHYSDRIKKENYYSDFGDYKDILEFHINDKYSVLLQTEEINKVTKFRKVKGCDDIIAKYTSNYIDMFQKTILEFLEEVYVEIISEICFWDLNKDLNSLREGAKKEIKDFLLKTYGKSEGCPQDEAEYNRVIRNQMHLDTLFAERAIILINERLMDYLHEYLLRKEGLLSKTFLKDFDIGE